jgi:hypothetical protein
MASKDPKDLFVAVLSHVRQGTERSAAAQVRMICESY